MPRFDRAAAVTRVQEKGAASAHERLDEQRRKAEAVQAAGGLTAVAPAGSPAPAPAQPSKPHKPLPRDVVEALREVVEVPIELIIDNPFDSCPIKNEALIATLAESIAAQGQLVPILLARGEQVAPKYVGRYILIEGHHRRDSHVRLKRASIKAIFVEVHGERDLFEMSQAANEHRRKEISAINQALSWSGALKSKLYESERELCERNGFNVSLVNRTLKLLELPTKIVDRMRAEPQRVGTRMGYALYQYNALFGEPEALVLAEKVFAANSRVTVEEVERYIKLNRVAKTRRKPHSRQFKIVVGEEAKPIGVLKDWDSGRILVDLKIEDGERRRQLLASLKETLAIKD
jgi:ParB family chromosome partitioning protein